MRNILRVSPHIIIISGVFIFLVTNQKVGLRFSIYALITLFVSIFLKFISRYIFSDPLKYRPENAGQCFGCDTYFDCEQKCIDVSGDIGMPSGHAMTFGMTAMFFSLWILYKSNGSISSKILRIVVLVLFSVVVILSRTRLIENCHTFWQVIIGTIIGIVLGLIFYLFEQKYVSKI